VLRVMCHRASRTGANDTARSHAGHRIASGIRNNVGQMAHVTGDGSYCIRAISHRPRYCVRLGFERTTHTNAYTRVYTIPDTCYVVHNIMYEYADIRLQDRSFSFGNIIM